MITHYLPLYRKYRPQSFADLVGQSAIAQTLGNAILMGRVAHAYLLCGPRGTGKTSTARIFAKTLNCEQGPTITPCQVCASCTSITQGNALDVIEFDAASNNGVSDARELIESCQYAPISGRYKIYIIDEVHMLSTAAFNALLKTLEEPPPNVIFIFATTEAHKVLPTIISRCQRFDFSRITPQQIAERLRFIATQEQIPIQEEALTLIARHARGGMRDAVGLLDQVSVLVERLPDGSPHPEKPPLGIAEVRLFIGSLAEDALFAIAEAITQKDVPTLLARLEGLLSKGIDPPQVVKDLTEHYRNLMLIRAITTDASGTGTIDPNSGLFGALSAESLDRLKTQSQGYHAEELPQILQQFSKMEYNIRSTQQPHLWLEVGLVGLAFRESIHRVEDLAQRLEALEARLSQNHPSPMPHVAQAVRPAPVIATQPAQTQPRLPVSPISQAIAEVPVSAAVSALAITAPAPQPVVAFGASTWPEVIAKVANMPTRALLQQQSFLVEGPTETHPNRLIIGVSSEPTLKMIQSPAKLVHLMQAAKAYYGREMQLDLVTQKKPEESFHTGASPTPSPSPPSGPVLESILSAASPVEPPKAHPPEAPHLVPHTFEEQLQEVQQAQSAHPVLEPSPLPDLLTADEPPEGLFDHEPQPHVHLDPLHNPYAAPPAPPIHLPQPTPAAKSLPLEGNEEAWAEARGFALQLLNGKVLD